MSKRPKLLRQKFRLGHCKSLQNKDLQRPSRFHLDVLLDVGFSRSKESTSLSISAGFGTSAHLFGLPSNSSRRPRSLSESLALYNVLRVIPASFARSNISPTLRGPPANSSSRNSTAASHLRFAADCRRGIIVLVAVLPHGDTERRRLDVVGLGNPETTPELLSFWVGTGELNHLPDVLLDATTEGSAAGVEVRQEQDSYP